MIAPLVTVCLDILIATGMYFFAMRCSQVGIFRGKLVRELLSFMDWEWRVKEFEKVSYNRMVFSFWKKLKPELFYDDLSFMGPTNKPVPSPFFQLRKP